MRVGEPQVGRVHRGVVQDLVLEVREDGAHHEGVPREPEVVVSGSGGLGLAPGPVTTLPPSTDTWTIVFPRA